MWIIIILFFIAIISAFGMLMFRAWELRTANTEKPLLTRNIFPEIYFRHVEKFMLYLTKYIIQWIVLVVIRYWFIVHTKTKKWAGERLPKIYKFFSKKSVTNNEYQKNSFLRKAIIESKVKIRKIKENVRKEHGEN